MTVHFVTSSDDVRVALHHLAPGPTTAPLLIAHATGFNAPAYGPLAEALADRFDVWGVDVRGHGLTPPAAGDVDWNRYGDDALAAAEWLSEQSSGAPLVGFGHSMGGTATLMAADRRPGLFRALALYEPIVFDPAEATADRPNPLADGAIRRRREFPSARAAIANFASKPPMQSFDPEALRGYVMGGTAPADPSDPDGPVRLSCSPELESATFRNSLGHDTWDRLTAIATPTVVIGGAPEGVNAGPAMIAPAIAERLAQGVYELHPELDHFGPFTHPGKTAAIVSASVPR
jgi:pimeloyl-ACP methyl ester carboxylesterase